MQARGVPRAAKYGANGSRRSSTLAGLMRVSERSPLLVYGQTPLFFYFAHFLSFLALGFLLFREPGTIAHVYLAWAAVVVALYPACVWYRRFKLSKPPESLWRMF